MKETIKIPFGVYYQEQFSKPMRRKQDVVSFISWSGKCFTGR